MVTKIYLTNDGILARARSIVQRIPNKRRGNIYRLYGVPRGGIPAMYAVANALTDAGESATFAGTAESATDIIDDIIDTGKTKQKYAEEYPEKRFHALVNKKTFDIGMKKDWVVFPWEHSEVAEEGIEANVTRILQHISEDPERGGLIETPTRVNKAWQEWASGYGKNPADVLKTFEDGGEDYDEMVVVNNIPVYSKCEHHLADIIGSATVGYIPNGKVVGLSKLSRLVNIFARRLQVQERLTVQVTGALMEHLSPLGAGCIINARHMCMESRGICQRGTITTTSSLCGVMRDDPAVRAEFIELAKNQAPV